ncbi:MAG: hypothetical protein ACE5GC_07810 [Acidimicrobiia bacterium]
MTIAIAIVALLVALVLVFGRLQGAREALKTDAEPAERKSRRQRKLDQIRATNPMPEPKSIFDIMMEEATDLGVDDVPGAQGLELPVKLKVWKRDTAIRQEWPGAFRYEIAPGVDAASATPDDVHLVGNAEEPAAPEPDMRSEQGPVPEPWESATDRDTSNS